MDRSSNWPAQIFLVLFPAAVGCVLGGLILDSAGETGRLHHRLLHRRFDLRRDWRDRAGARHQEAPAALIACSRR